jgi:protein-tyrosine phosphatase
VGRHVKFERLHNFRDVGGYDTRDGRSVRWRRLFRSDSLSTLAGPDWDRFLALGVRTVIDLRYPWEIEARGRVPDDGGYAYHNLSIEHRPYDQAALDPSVDPVHYLADRYAEVITDGVKELRQIVEIVAVAGNAPVVIHCASGKDRTGIVAALVLALLGVRERDIVADFALTGLATERLAAAWRANHPGRTLRWPGYGQAPAEVMRLFPYDVAARHGSLRGYATDQLGVDDALIDAMRTHLLIDK